MKKKVLLGSLGVFVGLCVWIMASGTKSDNHVSSVDEINAKHRIHGKGNCMVTALLRKNISSFPYVSFWCYGMENSQMGKPSVHLSCQFIPKQGTIRKKLILTTGESQQWITGSKIPVSYHFTDTGTFEDVGMIQEEMWTWDQSDQSATTNSSFAFNLFEDNIKPGRKVLFKVGDKQAVIEFDDEIVDMAIQPKEICMSDIFYR